MPDEPAANPSAQSPEAGSPIASVAPSEASDAGLGRESNPAGPGASSSASDGPPAPQLSASQGVPNGVASIAITQPGFTGKVAEAQRIGSGGRSFGKGPRVDSGLKPSPASSPLLDAVDDNEIMLRVAAGDDVAFDYLVSKYRRQIVSFMYRMAHNQAQAEELAQDVFLRVYRSRANYAAEARFTTWLYRIATNLVLNHARDTRSERVAVKVNLDEPDAETGALPDVADPGLSAEASLLRRERLAAIRQQVMALPEKQRVAVLMHKYQDMDYRQIAGVLKLSESATKSLLFRAYETLRQKLQQFA